MSSQSLGFYFEQRVNNFNLMRLLAAFAVIYGHASAVTGKGPADLFLQVVGYKFIGGVAVDVFFIISGFLITASAVGRKGLLYYVLSRGLRIYPALIVCMVFTVFVMGAALSESSGYWLSSQTWQYFWRNITLYGTEYFLPGVFVELHEKAVNGSLWSLPVEVRLYFIVFLLALVGVLKSRTVFNLIFFIAITLGYFFPEALGGFLEYENHRHVAMMFMIGSFAWVNRDLIYINPGVLLFLLFFAASQHGASGFGVAYAILLPYLVFCLAFLPGGAWFNRFGDYSYGVYLYGWIAQQLVLMCMPQMSNALNTLFGGLLAFCFAVVSWHLFERPALNLRKRFEIKTQGSFA